MITRDPIYDVIIVGGGPAGLGAAINGETERLNTLVLDAAPHYGGQAGRSSKIENYPGFPGGISGKKLTGLLIDHALQFDTELLAPIRAERIEQVDEGLLVHSDTEAMLGRSVLISSGLEFQHLIIPNLAAYLGRGIEYGSPDVEKTYNDRTMYVVGGANSAGQAAMFLSEFPGAKVHMLIRGKSIEEKMSGYLCDRVIDAENIEIHTETEIVGVDGKSQLQEVTLKNGVERRKVEADNLFIMIGSVPKTLWLPNQVAKDDKGFVKAGSDVGEDTRHEFVSVNGRPPLAHETSMAGLFVAGDVRCGTIKRVGTSIADGQSAIADLHRYFEHILKGK